MMTIALVRFLKYYSHDGRVFSGRLVVLSCINNCLFARKPLPKREKSLLNSIITTFIFKLDPLILSKLLF